MDTLHPLVNLLLKPEQGAHGRQHVLLKGSALPDTHRARCNRMQRLRTRNCIYIEAEEGKAVPQPPWDSRRERGNYPVTSERVGFTICKF